MSSSVPPNTTRNDGISSYGNLTAISESPINRDLLFDPTELDSLVLSHAHIDHCGNIPSLAKFGYDKPIYATQATIERLLAPFFANVIAFSNDQPLEGVVDTAAGY